MFRQHRQTSSVLLRIFCFACKSELGQRPPTIMDLSRIAIAFSCHHNADDLPFASHNNEYAVGCPLQQSKSFSRVLLNLYKGLVLHLLVGLLPMTMTLFAICSEKHTAI